MALNINRGVIDPFYRYKMPRLQAKVEGKGNGIKTVIANMTEIAKALGRPPAYTTKFFGYELGALTKVDKENERYIVNGDHDADKLQRLLDIFIRKFVLCSACDNPETVLTVKQKSIHSKCKACGHAYVIDSKNKLSTFIIKNPPPSPDASEKKDGKKQIKGVSPPVTGVKKPSVSQHPEDSDSDGSWADPTEFEKKLPIHIVKSVEERLDMLHQFFVEAKKDNTIQESKKLLNEAERLKLKNRAPLLLADVLFDADVLNQIVNYKDVFYSFVENDVKAQQYLLGGIEQLIDKDGCKLLPCAPDIIKKLFDEDLVEKEVLLAWGLKPKHKYVRKEVAKEINTRCQAVLKVIKEMDEGNCDKESDVEVSFDERSSKFGSVSVEPFKPNNVRELGILKAEEDEDEIDIDEI